MILVAVIEDERSELESLRRAIEGNGFHCAAAYATAETALRFLPEIKPHAVIVDLALPRMSGIRCIWELRRRLPKTEFLVHTIESRPQLVLQALQAGANGYLTKGASVSQIQSALHEVLEGGSPITPSIARLVVREFQARPFSPDATTSLSHRQEQVLALLVRGFTIKEVASQLGIGTETVKSHIRLIYQALQVHSRVELLTRFHGKQQARLESTEQDPTEQE